VSDYVRNAASIAGVGETQYWRAGHATTTEFELACRAVMRAVEDAGLELSDVDGLCTYSSERSAPVALAPALGMHDLTFVNLYPGGGNSAGGIVHNAALAVAAGVATTVVCYRSLCQGQFMRFGRARAGTGLSAQPMSTSIGGPQAFTAPFGLFSPAQGYALDARRHMHEFGTTSAQFGAVAVAAYANAQRNPRAVMYGRPLTLEQHQESRIIADPYRLFDCCQESDGSCAVVVTSSDRATHLRHPRVLITAGAQGMVAGDGAQRQSRPPELWTTAGMTSIAHRLYRDAGIGPQDVDVAQMYENFTGQVVMALEDFGFCGRGEGGPFVESGAIDWPDGAVPINTSGGNLAEAYIHGLSLVIEGARQLRGTSTSQVDAAVRCLVVSGPSAPPSSALVLSRD
jgi:acetyl-CoA acetyltransferase